MLQMRRFKPFLSDPSRARLPYTSLMSALRTWSPLFAMVSIAATIGLASPAIATPSAQDKASAKASWQQGKKLASQKKFDDAVAALGDADRLDPKAQYKLDLARALEGAGKLVEALEVTDAIAKLDEPNSKQIKVAAQKLASGVEPRVPSIAVDVGGVEGATATIDGESVKIGDAVKRDPGAHEVKAEAPSYQAATKSVTVGEGEKVTVKLVLQPGATMTASNDEPEKKHGGNMWPAGISFGVGAVGIGLGTVFGILAFKATSDVQSHCKGNVCPKSQEGNIKTARTDGNVSTAGFVIGGVGLAAGIVLALTVGRGSSEPAKDEKPKSATVTPLLGPGYLGAAGTF